MNDQTPPPAFLRKMDALFDLIARLCLILAGAALVVMTVIFAWLVFGRYVLNDTPTWVEQVSLLLLMVISFLVRGRAMRPICASGSRPKNTLLNWVKSPHN